MDVIDHIAARVSLAATMGAVAGVGTAVLKGHARATRTIALTAFSCAMVGTACFTTERVAAAALQQLVMASSSQEQQQQQNIDKDAMFRLTNSWEFVLTTHAIGGALGGALTGGLYLRRPLRGVAFFVPFMLLVGTGEKLLQDVRREHERQKWNQ